MRGREDQTPDFTQAVLGRLDDRRFFKSARARRMLALGRAGLGVCVGLVLLTTVFVQAAEWSKPWQPERQTVLGPIVRSTVVAAGEGLKNATQQSAWVVDLAPITSRAVIDSMSVVPAPVQRVGKPETVSERNAPRGPRLWVPGGAQPALRFVRVLGGSAPTAADPAMRDQLGAVSDDFETLERSARSSPCSPR